MCIPVARVRSYSDISFPSAVPSTPSFIAASGGKHTSALNVSTGSKSSSSVPAGDTGAGVLGGAGAMAGEMEFRAKSKFAAGACCAHFLNAQTILTRHLGSPLQLPCLACASSSKKPTKRLAGSGPGQSLGWDAPMCVFILYILYTL